MKNPDREARTLFKKGMKAAEKGLTAQTVEYLGQGLRIHPNYFAFWYFYAVALGELARYRESGNAFRRALRLSDKKRAPIWSAYADMLEAQGRFRAAEQSHRRATAARPRHASPWIRLGGFLAKRGRLDEAEACHRKATKLREGDIDEAFLNLGYILRSKGKYGQAQRCFLKAIQLDPGYSQAKAALKDIAPLIKPARTP